MDTRMTVSHGAHLVEGVTAELCAGVRLGEGRRERYSSGWKGMCESPGARGGRLTEGPQV